MLELPAQTLPQPAAKERGVLWRGDRVERALHSPFLPSLLLALAKAAVCQSRRKSKSLRFGAALRNLLRRWRQNTSQNGDSISLLPFPTAPPPTTPVRSDSLAMHRSSAGFTILRFIYVLRGRDAARISRSCWGRDGDGDGKGEGEGGRRQRQPHAFVGRAKNFANASCILMPRGKGGGIVRVCVCAAATAKVSLVTCVRPLK